MARVVVVGILVVATHFVTKSLFVVRLYAQRPDAKKTQKSAPRPAETIPPAAVGPAYEVVTTPEPEANGVADPKRPAALRASASSRLIESSITAVEGGLQFHGKLYLLDTNPEMKYMWSVKVVRADNPDDPFIRHYDQQIFTILNSDEKIISFDETIAFEPGDYSAVVSLYKLKPGLDLSNTDDNRVAGPFLSTRFGKSPLTVH
jgi:hypothetical protein